MGDKKIWIEDMKNAMNMIQNACGMLIWDADTQEYDFSLCEECPFFKACEALRRGSDFEYDYAEADLFDVFGK